MEPIFGLTPSIAFGHTWWLWQVVSCMFLHSTSWLGHLLLNMLMLWMFGAEVERALGTREFVKYYFVCGIGAGLTRCLMFWDNRTIGASGAVFGVMLAYAFLFPGRQILFWFIFPMSALTFVLLCTGMELYSLLSLSDNVAHIAHLGGMLFGYLYLKRVWRIRQFVDELRWKLRRRKFRVMRRGDDRPYPFHRLVTVSVQEVGGGLVGQSVRNRGGQMHPVDLPGRPIGEGENAQQRRGRVRQHYHGVPAVGAAAGAPERRPLLIAAAAVGADDDGDIGRGVHPDATRRPPEQAGTPAVTAFEID